MLQVSEINRAWQSIWRNIDIHQTPSRDIKRQMLRCPMTPRAVLNKLKWTEGISLENAEIWYVHRGAPDDTKIIMGGDIRELGSSFFQTEEATIPYHRIFKIVYKNEILFERKGK
jgi:uncharacterized protein (UPF0248 family)